MPVPLRKARRRWAELLQRIFEVDPLACPGSGQQKPNSGTTIMMAQAIAQTDKWKLNVVFVVGAVMFLGIGYKFIVLG